MLWVLLLFFSQFGNAVYFDPDHFDRFERLSYRYRHEDDSGEKEPSPLIEDTMLPKGVVPVHYDLTIQVMLPDYGAVIEESEKFTFRGIVQITIKNKTPVEEIVLNQKDLNVTKIVLIEQNGTRRKVQGTTDDRLEKLTILTGRVSPGEHLLEIAFMGNMAKGASGMFRSKYQSADNRTLVAAITQMEPIYARRVVLCFDEPEYKATWNVQIVHPIESEAVSNQIEIKTEMWKKDWKITSFETTPVMSSYLLAIGVFNFTHYEGYTNRGMRVRVYASPQQQNGLIALEQSIQCIEGFEEYFKIPIPLPKMDMVAAEQFFLGAMENWGLIYYSPSMLLGNTRGSVPVIAHELAHQWFGNLVTMKWWNNLYLNEGFASFMELKGLEFIQNGKFAKTIIGDHTEVFKREGTDEIRTPPIVYTLKNHSDIKGYSSVTIYPKGGSVLNMISKVMGDEKFLQGIRTYLRKYAYRNVEQDDLFAELDKVIGEDQLGPDGKRLNITHFAHQWTLQGGFPLVTLGESNSTHCEVTQQRYVQGKGKDDPRYADNVYGYKWDVPIWLQRTRQTILEFHWLPANGHLYVPCREEEPIILNPGSNALFITNYSKKGWEKVIIGLMLHKEIQKNVFLDAKILKEDGRLPEDIYHRLLETLLGKILNV